MNPAKYISAPHILWPVCMINTLTINMLGSARKHSQRVT